MPAKLYDWQNDEWQMVPDHMVGDLISAGTHSFESGVDVPVVSPDGKVGSMKAEEFQQSLADGAGFRFANYDDARANEERGREESMARITDTGPGQPGVFGTSDPQSQTFFNNVADGITNGGASWAARKIAGGLGYDEGGIQDIQDNLNARNPYHAMAGNLVGTVVGPVGMAAGALGKVASGAAGGLTEGIMAGVSRSETAAKIASTIASRTAGSAVEAAVFTGADQISEAAIGDPQEVAENLMSNVAASAIFGGKFGAAIGALEVAGPTLKKTFQVGTGLVARAVSWAEQKAAAGVIKPALTLSGQSRLKGIVGDVISDSEGRAVEMYGGGEDALRGAVSKSEKAQGQLQKQAKDLYDGITSEVSAAPKLIRQEVNATLAEAKGDIGQAMDALHERVQKAEEGLLSKIENGATDPATAAQPGVIIGDIEDATKTFGRQAVKRGDKVVEAVARDASQLYEAQKTINTSGGVTDIGAHQEVKIGFELRKKALSALDNPKLTVDGKTALEDYVKSLTKNLQEHPVYGEMIQTMDHEAAALDALSDATQKTLGKGNSLPKDFFVERMVTDPAFRGRMDGLLQVLPDVQGKIASFRAAGEDLGLKQDLAKEIDGALKDAGQRGGFTHAELEAIADKLGRKDVAGKLAEVQNIQDLLASDEPTLTKWGRTLDALGMEKPANWTKLTAHEDTIQKIAELRGPQDGNGLLALAKTMAAHKVRATVGGAIGGFIGHETFDGAPGYLGGAAAGALVGAMGKPIHIVNNLTKLERLNNQSAKLVSAMLGKAIDGLTAAGTTTGTRLAAEAYAVDYPKAAGISKENFAAHKEYLQKLTDNVQYRHEEALDRLGTIPGAPNISAAVIGQYSKGVDFLASKMPQDPMAGLYLNPAEAQKWHPSDVDLSKYNRYVRAAESPMGALDHIASGRGTPEEYETIETLYPTLFGKLQQGVLNAIMKPDTSITYQNRVQIGQFLGITPDPTLRPEFMATMQKPFIDQRAQASQGGGGSGGGAAHAASNPKVSFDPQANQTDVERVTFK